MGQLGKFITFEGGEGCGKSTQIKLLSQRLQDLKHNVVLTREPGGTPIAEKIRTLILTDSGSELDGSDELFLFSAARHNHVTRVIRPALANGSMVLSDRFYDSTTAYQGYGRGYSLEQIALMNKLATDGLSPDLTVIFDMDIDKGIARSLKRVGNDEVRFEKEERDFHVRILHGLLSIAKAEPHRCAVIDASGSIEEVQQRVWQVVSERLGVS